MSIVDELNAAIMSKHRQKRTAWAANDDSYILINPMHMDKLKHEIPAEKMWYLGVEKYGHSFKGCLLIETFTVETFKVVS